MEIFGESTLRMPGVDGKSEGEERDGELEDDHEAEEDGVRDGLHPDPC